MLLRKRRVALIQDQRLDPIGTTEKVASGSFEGYIEKIEKRREEVEKCREEVSEKGKYIERDANILEKEEEELKVAKLMIVA